MSHVVKIDVEIKDLDALEVAAGRLGLCLNRGQDHYRWYGYSVGDYPLPVGVTPGCCDHAISIPGNSSAYEIGVCAQSDGGFVLAFDFWAGGRGMCDRVGSRAEKLIEEYTIAAAESAAMAQGWLSQYDGVKLTIFHPDGGTITVNKSGAVEVDGVVGGSCVDVSAAIEQSMGRVKESSLKCEFFQEKTKVLERGE